MRIAIEGQRLFRKRKHGMDMVALELIRNLQKIDHENEYFIFIKPDEDRCLQSTDNFHIVELDGGMYPVWEQYYLPRAVKKYDCDILHCTSNTAPVNPGAKLVVTLHDIIYMEKNPLLAKGFTPYQRFGNLYRRWDVPRILKKAEKIITVSHFEKQRIASFFGLDDHKLIAVHNGVSNHFRPIKDQDELERIKNKYKLPERFVFFLGNTDPKKNTEGVIKAFALYVQKSGDNLYLVMPDYDNRALDDILQKTQSQFIKDKIHLTGYIDNKELPGIISQAQLFLYPSLRESFGIPILEAQRSGCPLITSNTSSMPEVAGDGALFVNPYLPEDIASKMEQILTNPGLRKDLIERGLKNSKRFSWENMATQVLKIYLELNSTKN